MKTAALTLLCLIASPAGAHPHIFVDTGLNMRFDAAGQLTEVEVTWAYDDFYSLLVTEDMELDSDYDGKLTDAERKKLTGFDMNWDKGFNGDLVITQGDQELTLSPPRDYTARLAAGRIVTTHVRTVKGAQASGPEIKIEPYDKTYYTAYDVTLPVNVLGNDACRSRVEMPDLSADLRALQEELQALDMATNPEDAGLPDIGRQLANTVVVTCAAS